MRRRTLVDARVGDVHEQHRPWRMRRHDAGKPARLREDDAVQAVDALEGHRAVLTVSDGLEDSHARVKVTRSSTSDQLPVLKQAS